MKAGNCCRRQCQLLLLVASWLVSGCATRPSREDSRRLHNWLICDECINGERQHVRRIGANVLEALDSALIGPSPQRRALMRAKLSDSYRFANMPGADSDAYINPRLANYIATYQKRAALSLGDIGNAAATRALDRAIREAQARGYRPDVIRAITLVRTRLGAVPFAGRITPGQLSFGNIVSVIAPPGQHFTAQDRAAIEDSPFPPDQIPFVRIGDTLQFVAVGDAGPHVIAVTRSAGILGTPSGGALGTPTPTPSGGPLATPTGAVTRAGRPNNATIALVTITSVLDATDRAMLSCAPNDVACAVLHAPSLLSAPLSTSPPITTFLTLSRVPPRQDSVDFLKVEPLTPLPLTALLDWHGPANLDLAWRRCSPFVPVGDTTGATFASVESTSVVVPARECWILQVSMRQGTTGPAFARLRIRSP